MANITTLQEHAMWTKAGPIMSRRTESDIALLEEQAMATIGDPAPLGLWAFATGTWMAGVVMGGLYPQTTLPGLAPVLLIFAGLVQFIAGLFAYRRANSLAATAFCCFGSFNVTAAVIFGLWTANLVPAGGYTPVLLGFLLESFAFIALALCLAALRTNATLVLILLALGIGYALAGIPNLVNAAGEAGWDVIGYIGGWFLFASAILAYYMGTALVVNSTWKRPALPIGGEP